MFPPRIFPADACVADVVAAAVDVAAVAEDPPLLLLALAIAAPTGRIKPPSTPDGAVLPLVPAAAALYAASVSAPELGGLTTMAIPLWQCEIWAQKIQMGLVSFTWSVNMSVAGGKPLKTTSVVAAWQGSAKLERVTE